MVLLGWLLGMQNARGPMALLLVANGVNVALDLLFVLGFGWGVAGVAAATVAAEYGGAGLGLWLALRRLRHLPGAWSWQAIGRRAAFVRLLAVNRDILLRSLCLEAAFLTFTALSSREGEVILAANAVLLNFLTFAAFGLDGFAHAAEAMVGRHAGAGSRAGVRAATAANLALALVLALILALAFALGGRPAIALMTGLAPVRATALHLPALPDRPAAGRRVRLPVRWRLHRRHAHRRDAQRHGAGADRVPARRLEPAALARQPRPLARDAPAHGRPRPLARPALLAARARPGHDRRPVPQGRPLSDRAAGL